MPERNFNWAAVHAFIAAQQPSHGPIAGTSEWCELAADDPAKLAGLFRCASAWVLNQELAELAVLRACKGAAVDVADARDWRTEARRITDRAQFVAAHPWAKRVIE